MRFDKSISLLCVSLAAYFTSQAQRADSLKISDDVKQFLGTRLYAVTDLFKMDAALNNDFKNYVSNDDTAAVNSQNFCIMAMPRVDAMGDGAIYLMGDDKDGDGIDLKDINFYVEIRGATGVKNGVITRNFNVSNIPAGTEYDLESKQDHKTGANVSKKVTRFKKFNKAKPLEI